MEPEGQIPARAWAEVDLGALRHNLSVARACAGPSSSLMAVVKADAYGHGLTRVVEALRPEIRWFGVANVLEGRQVLQAAPEATVFVLGALLPGERKAAAEGGMVIAISSAQEAEALQSLGLPVRVHLVVDTGMGRIGCREDEVAALREFIGRQSRLRLEGLASHLPSADEEEEFTREQLRRIGGLVPGMGQGTEIHLSNSAGLLKFHGEVAYATLHRPGLMLYGIAPLPEYQHRLRPVMALKSRVTLLRQLPPGRSISYGRTFVTTRETSVATVGIGYGDGYPRHLSGQGAEVLAGGRRCPVLGRVTMDQIMIDVTEIAATVQAGDEVVLFGEQGDQRLPVSELAHKAATIPWEILTGITRRVPRCYRAA